MAEQIIVDGYTRNALDSLPDWAKEETQAGLLKAAKLHGKQFDAMVKLLGVTAKGNKISTNKYNEIIREMKNAAKVTKAQTKQTKESDSKQERAVKEEAKRQMSMSSLLTNMVGHMSGLRADMEDYEKNRNKSNKEFLSALESAGVGDEARDAIGGGLSKLTKLGGKLNIAGAALSGAIAAIGAVEGGIQMMFSAMEERFNLSAELRQSGMFAAFDEVKQNLQSFSTEVMNNTFSLEQAASMARNFGDTVGVYGLANAMEFTKELRDESQYIEKYGANFNQLINITGEFLDSQKTLLALQGLDENRRLGSMDAFMQSVTLTSNVLKVGMEEAAGIIKDTLKDDDLTALMNTVMSGASADERTGVAALQASMGNTEMAKAVTMLAMAPEQFFASQEYAALSSDAVFQEALPYLQEIASDFRSGGMTADSAGDALENNIEGLRNVLNSDMTSALVTIGDSRAIVADIVRLLDGRMNAAGNESSLIVDPTDGAMAQQAEAVRMQGLLLETSLTRVISKMDDIPTMMTEHAQAVANLNAQIQTGIENSSGVIAGVAELAVAARTGTLNISAAALDLVNGSSEGVEGLYAPADLMNTAANKQIMAARSFERSVKSTLSGEYVGEFDPEQLAAMSRGLAANRATLLSDPEANREEGIRAMMVAADQRSDTGSYYNRELHASLKAQLREEISQMDPGTRDSISPEKFEEMFQAKLGDHIYSSFDQNDIEGANSIYDRKLEDQASVQNELISDLTSFALLNSDDRSAMGPEAISDFLKDNDVLNENITPDMLMESLNLVLNTSRDQGIITDTNRISYLMEELFGETGENSRTGLSGFNDSAKNVRDTREGLLNENAVLERLSSDSAISVEGNRLLREILAQMVRTRQNTDGMND